MRSAVYHQGALASPWANSHRGETIPMYPPWVLQTLLKSRKTQDTLETSCKKITDSIVYSPNDAFLFRLVKGLSSARLRAVRKHSGRKAIYSHICGYTMGRSLSGVISLTVTCLSLPKGIWLTIREDTPERDPTCAKLATKNSWDLVPSKYTWDVTQARSLTNVTSVSVLSQRVVTFAPILKFT